MDTRARYPIPKERFRSTIEVERSRFITTVQPIGAVEEAQAFVAEIKVEFPDANHNCWAYLVGPPGSTDRIGLSDDGEPHGTAGKPMLTALHHSGLGDTVVVVTRYFGGIKLGKGGMVKAYTNAVKTALELAPKTERVSKVLLQVSFDYSLVTIFQRQIARYEVEVEKTNYGELVCYQVSLPEEHYPGFQKMFSDLTSGRGEISKIHL